MTHTRKSSWLTALCGLAIAVTLVVTGCASSSARGDLEYGKALVASGRLKDANAVLSKAQVDHPGDKDIAAALTATRERFASFLFLQGNNAMEQQRWADAEANFKDLGMLPGYENSSKERLAALATARESAPRTVTPPTPAAGVQQSSSARSAATSVAAIPAVGVQPAASSSSSVARSVEVSSRPAAPVAASAPVAVAPAATPAAASAPVAKPTALSVLDDALSKKVTLQFRDAPVRSLFDAVGKSSGLNIVIDKDVQQDLRTSIYLKDTTVRNALDKIVLTTRLAWRPMDENTLIIYPDEQPKQNDYQGLVVRGFHLANADAKFVANSLKTVLKFRDVVVDEKLNMIVVRDTPQALGLAEQLIALHDVPEPEVMLEVTILEVTRGRLQNLGVAWPTSLSLAPLARTTAGPDNTTIATTSGSSTVTSNSANALTLRDLFNLTPGSLLLTQTPGMALNFNATDSDINILANPRIRAKNKEKAKILIGERVPNISATATSNGVVSQNITYVDVGLKLDVEPQVYPGNDISLKIGLEVSSINDTITNAANGTVAYRIGTRNATTVLRLRDGENQILAGLIQDSDRKTVSKVPLLGDIPLLGRLFRSDSTDKGKTEVVLSITPHLIRGSAKPTADGESFDAGTVTSVRGRRSDADAPPQVDQPVQQPQQPQQTSPDQQQPRRSRDD